VTSGELGKPGGAWGDQGVSISQKKKQPWLLRKDRRDQSKLSQKDAEKRTKEVGATGTLTRKKGWDGEQSQTTS